MVGAGGGVHRASPNLEFDPPFVARAFCRARRPQWANRAGRRSERHRPPTLVQGSPGPRERSHTRRAGTSGRSGHVRGSHHFAGMRTCVRDVGGHPGARLQRALAAGNLTAAEQAAFEVPFVPLTEARALLELYAERGDPKYERAALKYLRRYLEEADPSLADVAGVAALLAERAMLMRGV